MSRFYTADIDKVQADLFEQAVRNGVVFLNDRYMTSGGVLRPKSATRRLTDAFALSLWVDAVWIANGKRKTPSHWRSEILAAARDSKIEQVTRD